MLELHQQHSNQKEKPTFPYKKLCLEENMGKNFHFFSDFLSKFDFAALSLRFVGS